MAKLTTKKRNSLKSSSFVFPESRKFPINDTSHARNALSRAAAKGGSTEAKVKAAVHRKYPSIGQTKGGNTTISKDSLKGRGLTKGRENNLEAKNHFTGGGQTKDSLTRKKNPNTPIIPTDRN